jgi:hypothetical protein
VRTHDSPYPRSMGAHPTSGKPPWQTCSWRACREGLAPGEQPGINLLSTPLTIPLMGCQINSFRRVSSCGETMARRRKEERRAGTASPGM